MPASFTTELTREGIKLAKANGADFGYITVTAPLGDACTYQVCNRGLVPYGGDDAPVWKTLEAAEWYALALLANQDDPSI